MQIEIFTDSHSLPATLQFAIADLSPSKPPAKPSDNQFHQEITNKSKKKMARKIKWEKFTNSAAKVGKFLPQIWQFIKSKPEIVAQIAQAVPDVAAMLKAPEPAAAGGAPTRRPR